MNHFATNDTNPGRPLADPVSTPVHTIGASALGPDPLAAASAKPRCKRDVRTTALTTMSKLSAPRASRNAFMLWVRHCIGVLGITALAVGLGAAQAQVSPQICGQIGGRSYGPFDYRSAGKFERNIVENAHFTPEVEALIRGKTNNHVGPDLSYTLNVFPNHHRALVAAVRLTEKLKTDQPKGMRTIECYFERALRFARDDLIVEGLYAEWLVNKGRLKEAEVRIDQWLQQAGDNPALHYSAGLLYLELGNPEKALAQAQRAELLGWPQKDLAEKLRAGGHFRDAPGAAPAASSP